MGRVEASTTLRPPPFARSSSPRTESPSSLGSPDRDLKLSEDGTIGLCSLIHERLPFWLPPTRHGGSELSTDREIYPHPFIKLATVSVGFDGQLDAGSHAVAYDAIAAAGFEVSFGSDSGDGEDRVLIEGLNGPDALLLTPKAVSLTTAQYVRWERLRALLDSFLSQVAAERRVERVFLSILDELRPQGDMEPEDWATYVKLPVLSPELDLGYIGGMFGGLTICADPAHHRHITVQWTQTEQDALPEDHPLARHYESPEGPILALDWMASTYFETPSDIQDTLAELDTQHAEVKEAFEKILTEESFELMRGTP